MKISPCERVYPNLIPIWCKDTSKLTEVTNQNQFLIFGPEVDYFFTKAILVKLLINLGLNED